MRVHVEIQGKTPLMMHNERLADPDDEYVKLIKEIVSKRSDQTESDKLQVSRLEWRGGLYLDEKNEIVIPTANIMRCLRDAATITKSGRKITRGLSMLSLNVPLEIGGPRHVDKLIDNQLYYDRRMVKVSGRVKRTRPLFPKWALSFDAEMMDDVLNFNALMSIVELAGRATGLCEARILGYGRFEAKVTKAKS